MDFGSVLAQPLTVGSVTIRNRVLLAPMSGITDLAFRSLAIGHGCGIAVSEMVASGELAKGHIGSRRRIRAVGNCPSVVQLAGRDAGALAEAARIAEGEGAAIIDINMGCPAKKVTGGYAGSALMRDLDHAIGLVDAVVAAVSVPVTVKMRLGWDEDCLNAPHLARRAEQSGVRMVTVHGRTRCQFYTGKADWRAIRRVKDVVSIPVVGNGDVRSLGDAVELLAQSHADAVMIGRAAYGAPWTPGAIAAAASGEAAPGVPNSAAEMADYVRCHHEAMLSVHGVESGLRQARKHLGWYVDRHAPDTAPSDRLRLMKTEVPAEAHALIRGIFAEAAPVRLASAA